MVKGFIEKWDRVLTGYLQSEGDDQETLAQKKLWWLFNVTGLPFLIALSIMIGDSKGPVVVGANVIFALAMIVPLSIFHFHKSHIDRYVLFMQLAILILCSLKVYLMGGLLEAGTPIFIGLTSPLYALATGNRKRALILYLCYIATMIIATELQPDTLHNYFLFYSYIGFSLGITIAFIGPYYYTHRLERLKQKEKLRMQELDRLKTNFFTHITHELRTPLTIILGMANQLAENPRDNMQEGLKMISRNGEKLLKMTNQLLDLSRMEARLMPVHWVQQDIVSYLKYLVESFHSYAESKDIELLYLMETEKITMDFDPEKIRDILSNLISNAIKFTPAGGRVEVRLKSDGQNGVERIHILVADTGAGIEQEYLPRIFERYFQAQRHVDELTEGSGLGLAITRELVQLMHGTITVSSELDRGSVFTVTLPVTNNADPAEIVGRPEPSLANFDELISSNEFSQAEHDGKLKLLIVEDSQDVATYLDSLLSSKYHLLHAHNGREGLEMALDEVPDLIISDVMMPLMDGFALCKKLKHDIRTSHIPIILLTARNETAAKMEGLRSGADAYLGKPFNKEELFIRVHKLIALRKELRDSLERLINDPLRNESKPEVSPDIDVTVSHKQEYTFLNRVREIVELHLSEDEFGISDLSAELGMSRSQLYRKFTALTDSSVHQFIKNFRLKKARNLLQTTDLNVSEVAYDTGFKNPSHFSRIYNERFGMPPSKEKENVMA